MFTVLQFFVFSVIGSFSVHMVFYFFGPLIRSTIPARLGQTAMVKVLTISEHDFAPKITVSKLSGVTNQK